MIINNDEEHSGGMDKIGSFKDYNILIVLDWVHIIRWGIHVTITSLILTLPLLTVYCVLYTGTILNKAK